MVAVHEDCAAERYAWRLPLACACLACWAQGPCLVCSIPDHAFANSALQLFLEELEDPDWEGEEEEEDGVRERRRLSARHACRDLCLQCVASPVVNTAAAAAHAADCVLPPATAVHGAAVDVGRGRGRGVGDVG